MQKNRRPQFAAPATGNPAILKPRVDRESIIGLLEEIRATFPALRMDLQREHLHVDLNMDVQKQPGLAFDINLNFAR
jgi:hypothetical protein